MRPAVTPLIALVAAAASALPGCRQKPGSGAPAITYGEDACAHCGMVIVDERFACAAAPAGAAPLFYDDPGCLLNALKEGETPTAAPVWAHDADGKQWVPAASAWFVRDENVQTPMGSGIAAYATEAAARAKGTPLSWKQLVARHPRGDDVSAG
jgi:copper chaperone NosL